MIAGGTARLISSSKYIALSYKPFHRAEAILVVDDRVVASGKRDELLGAARGLGAEEINYEHPVLPGFVDAHIHVDGLGVLLNSIDLRGVRDVDELGNRVAEEAKGLGEWIIGRGFDHNLFPDKEPPTRKDLDRFAGDRPVLVIHRSGHMGVVNSQGLEKLIGVVDLAVSGGVDLERGFLYEDALMKAYEYIKSHVPALDYIDIYRSAIDHIISHGVTSIGIAGCTGRCLKGLRVLERFNQLRLRTHVYLYPENVELEHIIYEAVEGLRRNSLLRVNGVKVFMDGALGTHTAYLSSPYSDKPDTRGKLLMTRDEFEGFVDKASRLGLQVAVHAIGDAALDVVLDTYSRHWSSVLGLRHRIEHASLVRDDQHGLIRELRPVIVVQPHFIITDKWLLERIGMERIHWAYPFRTLYEETAVGFSTDAPVEPINPWETIYAAITRGAYEGLKHGTATRSESMDLLSALDAYTRGSAYALFDDRIGCLEPGCYADYIVVDKDPLEVGPREIAGIKVLETVLGGERVYSINGGG